jgi:hypothetical protein
MTPLSRAAWTAPAVLALASWLAPPARGLAGTFKPSGAAQAGATGSSIQPVRDAPLADFRDLAPAAGLDARTTIGGERTKDYILETTGGGAAIVDYDSDGLPDIFLVNGARRSSSGTESAPSRLYRNNGDGTFTDVTARAGVGGQGWGQGVAAGDYDNDGHPDLFVTYYGHHVLYRNRGDGTFADATPSSGIAFPTPRWSTGAAFLDFDRDGHLDLFVSAYVAHADAARHAPGSRTDCFWKGLPVMCGPKGLEGSHNALFRGNGDGTFADVSEKAGLLKVRPAYGFTPLVLDYDNDRWPDVYVANDSNASFLFHNNRDGTFRDMGLQAGVALTADGRAQAGMGVGAGDYNRDGLLDIVKTNFDDDTTSLYRNLGGGTFEDATAASGLGAVTRFLGWGTGFFDFDLDSWPDIFIVNGHVYPEADRIGGHYSYAQRKIVYRNLGDGRFEEVSTRVGPGIATPSAARGAATGDLFNSGRQDIVVNNMHGVPMLLHDCAAAAGRALVVQLEGTRSNRSGIGARVTVQIAGRRLIDEVRSGGSFCSQNDLRLHFGLGQRATVDRIEVIWPGGATDAAADVAADQLVVVREGAGIVRRQPLKARSFEACGSK